ncbi:MAG TPA: hypothetical protein VL133_07955, partial [Devosia sp.]|nr:hypothetical protein [Devosia sp.]
VLAASEIIAERSADALVVIAFDAVDNARIGANRWKEPCFLDELTAASAWPDNVRVIVTCRSARLKDTGASHLFEDFPLAPFDAQETERLIMLWHPGWDWSLALTLHDLTGGNPRRLTYALEGVEPDQQTLVVERLLPKATGLDPLFEKRVAEAGVRLGGETRLWPMLSALARLPRPVPAAILADVADLEIGDIGDVATDIGGMTLHAAGWSFHDEDFEGFVDTKTRDLAATLLGKAADHLWSIHQSDDYAARAIGEVLVSADRMDELYRLVTAPTPFPPALSDAEKDYVRSQRLALSLRACRQSKDLTKATTLLIASAEAVKRQSALERLIVDNLDLSVRFEPEAATRLVMTGPRYRKHRARHRIESAIATLPADPVAGRSHFRWWSTYVDQLSIDRENIGIGPGEVAAEFRYMRDLAGEESAFDTVTRWGPIGFLVDVFARAVREAAGGGLAALKLALTARSWPPRMLAPIAAAALLSGATFDDAAMRAALSRLAAATPSRWKSPIDSGVRASGALTWHEATLWLCEQAIASTALRGDVAAILASAFPVPKLTEGFELYRLASSASRWARIIAMQEVLTAAPVDVQTWLPPPKTVPARSYEPVRFRVPEREETEEERWNKSREEAVSALELLLIGARGSMALVCGDAAANQDLAGFYARAKGDAFGASRTREVDGTLLLVRSQLLHASRLGRIDEVAGLAAGLVFGWCAERR